MELIKQWFITHYSAISAIVAIISLGFFIIFAFIGNYCLEKKEEK